MNDFLYAGYIERLAKRFDEALSEIEAVHNFEYGAEFEVAICKVLRRVLPHKYAVCRGYVVDESGHTSGDDIVIFDRIRFPTLRSRDEEDFSLKEHVPIDAAYAYIEAKHTLDIDGNGESSLARATEQSDESENSGISTIACIPSNARARHIPRSRAEGIGRTRLALNSEPHVRRSTRTTSACWWSRH
jgi:hypothetical protein